jgi:hypothetical protein
VASCLCNQNRVGPRSHPARVFVDGLDVVLCQKLLNCFEIHHLERILTEARQLKAAVGSFIETHATETTQYSYLM